MKKLITLSVLLFSTSLIFGQETPAPKPIIKSYSANQNYFAAGILFESNGYIGGQLTLEKSINELFSIGINGSYAMYKEHSEVGRSIHSKGHNIGFYPHIRAHTVELLNLPKYLDLYVTLGLNISFSKATTIYEEYEGIPELTLESKDQDVYLRYGIGAKYQITPKTGVFIDYNRRNVFAFGVSFAINKKV